MKEYPKISNFLQFESHSSKSFKVRAISDLRDLYGNKIQGPLFFFLLSGFSNVCHVACVSPTALMPGFITKFNTLEL